MNKILKKLLIVAMAICFVLATVAFVACDKTEKTTYTVTVTCQDASALTNIKVQINKGTTKVEEKALTEGKATFELEPGDYTATLDGVPADYTFSAGTLTATTTSCTIALTKKTTTPTGYTYTVNVTYPDILDVYDNTVTESEKASGVTVKLYEGELEDDKASVLETATLADTKTTDSNGKATFELTGELYTVVLEGYKDNFKVSYPTGKKVITVSKEAPTANLTFSQKAYIGESTSAPLTFELGENEVPLTNDALEKNEGMGVCYAFTPEEGGNYTISATGNARIFDETAFQTVVLGGGSKVLALEADETCYFFCSAQSTPQTYTVTIEKGGTVVEPEDDRIIYPWEGKGEYDTPYILEKLAGEYSLYIEDGKLIYLQYTPSANEEYTITSTTNAYFSLFTKHEPTDEYDTGRDSDLAALDGSEATTVDITLTAGTTYYLEIDVWNYGEYINFKIATKGTPDDGAHHYPWAGDGTEDSPYIIKKLEGEYSLYIPDEDNLIYLQYTPETDEEYTITSTENAFIEPSYIGEMFGHTGKLPMESLDGGGVDACISKLELRLTANTTYYFKIDVYNYATTLKFTISKGIEPGPDGTVEHPYLLEPAEDTHNRLLTGNSPVYFYFTAEAAKTYVVSTADDNAHITIYERKENSDGSGIELTKLLSIGANNLSEELTVEAGKTYLVEVAAFEYDEDGTNVTYTIATKKPTYDVDITVKLADGSPAPEGITVTLVDENLHETTAVTNAQGVAHFTLPDGKYTVNIKKLIFGSSGAQENGPIDDSFEFPASMYTVTVDGAATTKEVQYRYYRALDITVKNADGSLAVGVEVTIISDGTEKSATTDEHGVAHFTTDDRLHDGETFTVQVTDKTAQKEYKDLGTVTLDDNPAREVTLPAEE